MPLQSCQVYFVYDFLCNQYCLSVRLAGALFLDCLVHAMVCLCSLLCLIQHFSTQAVSATAYNLFYQIWLDCLCAIVCSLCNQLSCLALLYLTCIFATAYNLFYFTLGLLQTAVRTTGALGPPVFLVDPRPPSSQLTACLVGLLQCSPCTCVCSVCGYLHVNIFTTGVGCLFGFSLLSCGFLPAGHPQQAT